MTLPGAAVNTSPKQDVKKLLLVAGEQKRGVSPSPSATNFHDSCCFSVTHFFKVCSEKLSQMKVDELLKKMFEIVLLEFISGSSFSAACEVLHLNLA